MSKVLEEFYTEDVVLVWREFRPVLGVWRGEGGGKKEKKTRVITRER